MTSFIGKRTEVQGSENWIPIDRPSRKPRLRKGHRIVGCITEGGVERIYLCKDLKAMQDLWDGHHEKGIRWYQTNEPYHAVETIGV